MHEGEPPSEQAEHYGATGAVPHSPAFSLYVPGQLGNSAAIWL